MSALVICEKGDVVVASFIDSKIVDQPLIQQIAAESQTLMAQATTGKKLLVDFSRVESVSSLMLGLMARLHGQCKQSGVKLKLCAASPVVLDAFRVTGLRKVLQIYSDEAAAIEAFDRPDPEMDL
jgi:anti-sigma B factor antagonist